MEQVRLGIIGCGGFSRHMHVPNLLANDKFAIVAAADLDLNAAETLRREADANYATTDPARLLGDPTIDAVLIATRHDSHAALSVAAARAGKHVLCEKPMALNREQCRQVMAAVRQAGVVYTIGYNRGLSPLISTAREIMEQHGGGPGQAKKMIYHRIQAPFPASHWTHDPAVGGGRFVGEGCHIFDLFCELVGAPPVTVYAAGGTFLDPAAVAIPDSALVTIGFADGSVATTLIASDGCAAFPKEATEIYWAGKAIQIVDFRQLSYHGVAPQGEGRLTLESTDKGHRREIDLYAEAVLHGAPPPNPLENAWRAALLSFLVNESLAAGQALPVDLSPSS